MSDIEERFATLKAAGRKGFIPFITAGDPNLETSFEILLELAEKGADVIEVGVPFSDPMADGPTIQRSSQRALANGVSLPDVIDLIAAFKQVCGVPVVLFSYLNPLWQYGLEKLARDAYASEIDGILVTDITGHEAREISALFPRNRVDLISLVAPTTTDDRLGQIAAAASGFIYAVSRAGVTGAQENTSSAAEDLVGRVKRFTALPVAVGFGISTRAQIEDVWRYADAAVVGSAIVAEIERVRGKDVIPALDKFLADLVPPRV